MKKRKSNREDAQDFYASGYNSGIEPPRLYRQEQNKIVQSQKKEQQPLTRQQKREKQNSRRRLKRSVRRALLLVGLVILTAAIVVVLSLTVFFKIDTIAISGGEIYTEEEILSAFTIDIGENLFLSDTNKAADKLSEALPYIYKAEIRRKLPATISIKITDAVPAYAIQNKDKTYIILDDTFKVLEIQQKQPEECILISKAEVKNAVQGKTIEFKNEKVAGCLTQLANAVKTYEITKATGIYSEGLTANYIVYDNRILFKLGTCDDLETKIYQGLAACEELDAGNPSVKGTLRLTGEKQYYFTEE